MQEPGFNSNSYTTAQTRYRGSLYWYVYLCSSSEQESSFMPHCKITVHSFLPLGLITGGEIHDRFSRLNYGPARPAGPFATVKASKDSVQLAALPVTPMYQRKFEGSCRPHLPETGNIYFSHGDLHFGNIMVSQFLGQPVVITGVMDWKEAGCYPSNWEYCKMNMVIDEDEVLNRPEYIELIIPNSSEYEMASESVGEYWEWRGFP